MLLLIALIGVLAACVSATAPAAGSLPPPAGLDFQPAARERSWNSIVLHHSATAGGSVESIDAVHRRQKDAAGRPWLGIGYHFVIGNGHSMDDGQIRPTFRWHQQLAGAHAGRGDIGALRQHAARNRFGHGRTDGIEPAHEKDGAGGFAVMLDRLRLFHIAHPRQ